MKRDSISSQIFYQKKIRDYTDYCRRDLAFLVEGVNCRSPQVLEAAQFCVKLCKLKFALAGAYAGLVGGLKVARLYR
jgi:hypothetical protein